MKRYSHFLTALFLTLIYTGIIMGPLAPLISHSSALALTMAGECSGNCDICGCSAERRANHTCCCWQKRLRGVHQRGDCCKKKVCHKMKMLRCACPCGDKKQPGISAAENPEHLPSRFTGEIVVHDDSLASARTGRLFGRTSDPPDPPPKLISS